MLNESMPVLATPIFVIMISTQTGDYWQLPVSPHLTSGSLCQKKIGSCVCHMCKTVIPGNQRNGKMDRSTELLFHILQIYTTRDCSLVIPKTTISVWSFNLSCYFLSSDSPPRSSDAQRKFFLKTFLLQMQIVTRSLFFHLLLAKLDLWPELIFWWKSQTTYRLLIQFCTTVQIYGPCATWRDPESPT